jgi:hypothetical protein
VSPAEARLLAQGYLLEEVDFGDAVDAEVSGCILAGYRPGGVAFHTTVRPELDPAGRAMFAEWAEGLMTRFVEHGPGVDGWQHRGDDDWQLWARPHYFGDLLDL